MGWEKQENKEREKNTENNLKYVLTAVARE